MKNDNIKKIIDITLKNKNIIDLFSEKKCKNCFEKINTTEVNISNLNYNVSDINDVKKQLLYKNVELFFSITELGSVYSYFFNLSYSYENKKTMVNDFYLTSKISPLASYSFKQKKTTNNLFKLNINCNYCLHKICSMNFYNENFPEITNRKFK